MKAGVDCGFGPLLKNLSVVFFGTKCFWLMIASFKAWAGGLDCENVGFGDLPAKATPAPFWTAIDPQPKFYRQISI
jgi:hypothetical protein